MSVVCLCVSYGGQHGDVVGVVAGEGEDGHALVEPLDAAELHHEAVLLAERLQGLPVPLVLTERLQLSLRGQEPHQTLHEVHAHCPHVEPAHNAP